MNAAAFDCVQRRVRWWQRWSFGAHRHEPDPNRPVSIRLVEWSEFRGMPQPMRAANCRHCSAPLVLHPAGLWQVRWFDSVDKERARAARLVQETSR